MDILKIKSLTIEHRSRIQAGNCFISFNNNLEKHQTKVSLKQSEVIVQVDDDVYTIETKDFFEINIKSFHSLLVKDSFISFRFITANEKQFDAEVLKAGGEFTKFQRIKLSLDSNKSGAVDAVVACSNCDSSITNNLHLTLQRILELPSSNLDVSDWFCHRHDDEKLFDDTSNESAASCFDEKTHQFQPKRNDVFYGPFYLLMNSQNFDKTRLIQKKKLIYCKRCLQMMGESNNTITKLWCESVKFNGKPFFDVDSSINLLKLVIKNHLACDGFVQVAPIAKIIFESVIRDNQKIHILVQVMDRSLQLLKLNLKDSKLLKSQSIKLMYLKLNHENADDERALKYWQKDINIVTYELSFKMFYTLSEYLKSQSELIPDAYRTNNGFQLSYVDLL